MDKNGKILFSGYYFDYLTNNCDILIGKFNDIPHIIYK